MYWWGGVRVSLSFRSPFGAYLISPATMRLCPISPINTPSLILVVEREDSNGRFTDSKLLVLLVPYVSVPNYDFSAPFIATTCINERIQVLL